MGMAGMMTGGDSLSDRMPHFEPQRAVVRGVEIAFLREGAGGFPLLLLHGWPESMGSRRSSRIYVASESRV
jgi:pimeloyl-ACP methyl ester carboxylesterase